MSTPPIWGCVSPATIARLRAHWEQLKKHHKGLGFVDTHLRRILVLLNRLNGVATVWSCSGHPNDDGAPQRLYIAMACTPTGLRRVQRIAGLLDQAVQDHGAALVNGSIFKVELSMERLAMPSTPNVRQPQREWFNAVTLQVNAWSDRYSYTTFCKLLETAILSETR